MTREQTKALLPVLVAWSEGRAIQMKLASLNRWMDMDMEGLVDANFDARSTQWRVKPQPREFWVVVSEDFPMDHTCFSPAVYFCPVTAPSGSRVIHCREVVE